MRRMECCYQGREREIVLISIIALLAIKVNVCVQVERCFKDCLMDAFRWDVFFTKITLWTGDWKVFYSCSQSAPIFTAFRIHFFHFLEYIFPNDWTRVIDHLRRNEIGVFFLLDHSSLKNLQVLTDYFADENFFSACMKHHSFIFL